MDESVHPASVKIGSHLRSALAILMKHTFLPILGAFAASAILSASAALPVQNEQIVVTCFSGGYTSCTAPASAVPNNTPTGFVVAIFNTTSAQINSLIPPPASPPALWTGPTSAGYHNELNPGQEWNRNRLGEVFGITLDDSSPPNIYVAASDAYNVIGASSSLNVSASAGPGGIAEPDSSRRHRDVHDDLHGNQAAAVRDAVALRRE
jgi:hypothetical protein